MQDLFIPGKLLGQPTMHDAFMSDIIEHPEDDTPRLIFADWLEDNGQEQRAEFIRLQIKLALPPLAGHQLSNRTAYNCVICDRIEKLNKRCNELLNACSWSGYTNRFNWSRHDGINSHVGTDNVTFRRGFVAEINAPIDILMKHLPAWVQQHPIEVVQATDKEPWTVRDHNRTRFRWFYERPNMNMELLNNEDIKPCQFLPLKVWKHMPEDMDKDGPRTHMGLDYPTIEAAHAALSIALLKLAKE